MLAQGERGNAHSHGGTQRKGLVSVRKRRNVPRACPAQPAVQAVDGGKQVHGGIQNIQRAHQAFPHIQPLHGGARHGGGQAHKKHKTHALGNKIGGEKPACAQGHGGTQAVMQRPKRIAAKIDAHRPRDQRNGAVKRSGKLVVMPRFGQRCAAPVNKLIPQKRGGRQQKPPACGKQARGYAGLHG